MHTEAINHDPAITFIQTGSQLAGPAEPGRWLSYGLGSENENLPAFIVLISKGRGKDRSADLRDACGAAAFCRRSIKGVKFRSRRAIRCSISPTPRDRRRQPRRCSTA